MQRRSFGVLSIVLLGVPLLTAPIFGLRAQRGMVAADHRLASEAGAEILRRGGNAVDAAVAAALAVGVTNPSSCGLGGGGFMVIFDRSSQRVFALDYRETAPRAAHRELYVRDGEVVPGLSTEGGLAVAVPGEIAGSLAALERFGTLPFGVVAGPAIRLARDGFPVEKHLAESIAKRVEVIRRHPPLARLLLKEGGKPHEVGDVLRQPELARVLETVAEVGAEGFYGGWVADAIVGAVVSAGGLLTVEDLRGYQARWREPVRGAFRGNEVFAMPPPSSGGGVLVSVLNTIAHDDLEALGHNSPTYIHLLAESLQFAFADRAAHYGDPDFFPVPLARMIALSSGRVRRMRLSAARTYPPQHYGRKFTADDGGTSHLSVIDGEGNAVALTTSINTGFGSKVLVPGTGIILNNTMDDFSAQPGVPNVYGLIGSEANAIEAGKRPLSSMSPTIVVRNGEAVAVAGGSGGPLIITATLQALLDSLVFEMSSEDAVTAPRLHHQWMPPVLFLEESIREIDDYPLSRLGHSIRRSSRGAAVQLIRRSADGWLDGASDPRKGGRAAGW